MTNNSESILRYRVPTYHTFSKVRDSDLEVLEAAGEVQDVPEVGLGISVGTGGLGEFQLLRDGVQLEGSEKKHLASGQQLLTWENTHKQHI